MRGITIFSTLILVAGWRKGRRVAVEEKIQILREVEVIPCTSTIIGMRL